MTHAPAIGRDRVLLALLTWTLAGTAPVPAADFAPRRLDAPAELRDVQARTVGDVTVAVSILTDEQARRHFGVDLGKHDLQALWMSVRNGSGRRLWFIRNQLDPDFYSAEEAALLMQGGLRGDKRAALHQHFRDESMRALMLPGTITQGYVYLPRIEGGRYVDIRLQGDAHTDGPVGDEAGDERVAARVPWELRFEFALPLPDGDFDYERLDPARTFVGRELPDLALGELRSTLEQLPCCATDASGEGEGDPLNVVLVGSGNEVLASLTRAGWSFTHRIALRTVQREIGAAIAGTAYPVAPVSSLYAFGRKQDVALQRARRSIAQRNHMRLWLAPWTYEGRSVWIGQVSRDIGIKTTTKSPTLTTHVIDPEVDTTREYLLHSLIAQGLVGRFGFVQGSRAATPAEPRRNLSGDPWFSDGLRLVVMLAREPIPPGQVRNLHWEQSAAPIAEGQSEEAARRNVRPIDATAESREILDP